MSCKEEKGGGEQEEYSVGRHGRLIRIATDTGWFGPFQYTETNYMIYVVKWIYIVKRASDIQTQTNL